MHPSISVTFVGATLALVMLLLGQARLYTEALSVHHASIPVLVHIV